jgi:hypothetical protein
MDDILGEKKGEKYFCRLCDYKSSDKTKFNRHLSTQKHLRMTQELQFDYKKEKHHNQCEDTNYCQKFEEVSNNKNDYNDYNNKHKCYCGREYKYRQGLWKHQSQCLINKDTEKYNKELDEFNDDVVNKIYQEIIKQKDEIINTQHTMLNKQNDMINTQNDMIKEKTEIINEHKQVLDLTKQMVHQTSTNNSHNTNNSYNTNINNINNNFNLQCFLNVQCKDALNISEFIDTLEVSIQDLEETGRAGYVEGVSKVFNRGLDDLDVSKRPIHCSDLKREILYVKDKNVWEKEEDNREKLKQIIRSITNKNIKQIFEWQKLHPDYNDASSKTNDKYLNILYNSVSGSTDEETQRNYEKIISKVAKKTVIQK